MAGYKWKGTHTGPDLFDATEPKPRVRAIKPIRCGTYPAYARHRYNQEPACRACKNAKNEYERKLSHRKQTQGG